MKIIILLYKLVYNLPYKLLSKNSLFSVILDSKVHKSSSVGRFSRIYSSNIERNSYIGGNGFVHSTSIGSFCSISDNCFIGGASHPVDWLSTSPVFMEGRNVLGINYSTKKYNPYTNTVIGNDVWIGYGVIIKAGVTIGNGAIIGAGSIVTKDVEPYTIVAGNPARKIKVRFDEETIAFIDELQWWNMSDRELNELGKYVDNINSIDKNTMMRQGDI